MKRLATVFLTLAGFAALAGSAGAQNAPVPDITSVPQRKSYQPNTVAVLGTNLGLVTEVKVNGVAYPITRVTASRLTVGPVAPQDPGFGLVEIFSVNSSDSAPISLVPNLSGVRRRTRVDLSLNNGDTGTYILRYAYSVLGAPAVDQNVYGPRWLQIASPVLTAGVFPDSAPLAISALMPVQIGQIGSALRLQAQTTSDTYGVEAYTNLLTLNGFNGNPLP